VFISVVASFVVALAAASDVTMVLRVDSDGLLPTAVDAVETSLRSALARRSTVLANDDAQRRLGDAVASGLRCDVRDDSCLLRIAIATEVSAVVTCHVGVVDGRGFAVLQRVPVRGGSRLQAMEGPVDALHDVVDALVPQLYLEPTADSAPPRLPMSIHVSPAAADTMRMDGVDVKPVSLHWVLPGPHRIDVAAAGFDSAVVDVVVGPMQVPTQVDVQLRERSIPTAVVVAGAVGATAATLGFVGTALSASGGTVPQEAALAVGIGGAVVMGGAMVFAVVSLWSDSTSSSSSASVR
jgi:hypothetical protein